MEQCVLHFQGTRCGRLFCFSSFFLLVLLFCPCGSLLDVSRPLGLTLRRSAPVCVATGTP